MLCADCHIHPPLPRRSRCRACDLIHRREIAAMRNRPGQYCREDHAGQRARLKEAIAAAIQAGAIVPGVKPLTRPVERNL